MKSIIIRSGLVLAATLLILLGTLNPAMAWTLSGTVYGGSNPLANATVILMNAGTLSQVGTTTTNDSGFYSFTVSDGIYNLTVTPSNSSGYKESVVNGLLISGADVVQNVVLVAQPFTLSGIVRYPDGTAAPNISVSAADNTMGGTATGGSAYTDSFGAYSIPVSVGSFNIFVAGGTFFGSQAKPGPEYYSYSPAFLTVAGNVVHDITLPPFVTISGKTTDANGIAVGNVRLDLRTDSFPYTNGQFMSIGYRNVYSDAVTGMYSMVVIPHTNYSLTVYPPSGSGFQLTTYSSVSITSNTTRDFALTLPIVISGIVRYPDGTAAPNISVSAADNTVGGTATGGSTITDSLGAYSIPVSVGSFNIFVAGGTFFGSQAKPGPEYYSYSPAFLTVAGNVVHDITLPPFVTISGKTTDANGIAVGNVRLDLHTDSFPYTNGQLMSIGYRNVYSDAVTGMYSMVVIPHTNYAFTVYPPSGSGFQLTTYSSVSITSNTTRDFALTLPIVISGIVRYPDGTAAPNISVSAADNTVGGTATGGSTITDSLGAYSIPVSVGSFNIFVAGGTFFGSQAKPGPEYYSYSPAFLTVAGNVVHDITLPPFVTISGKTTDANGIAVGNVRLDLHTDSFPYTNGQLMSIGYRNVYSDAVTGMYSMVVIPHTNYAFTVYPPSGSGFIQTTVNSINIINSILQNWIMSLPDTNPPIILSGPVVSSVTDSTVTIEWQTNEPAKGEVVYGTSDPPSITVAESDFKSDHSLPLSGLSANTAYYISVNATDKSGNGPTTSSVISFTTKPIPDTTPPVILEGPVITNITAAGAVVEWKTNEPTTGNIQYGTTDALGQTIADSTLSSSHRVELSGLTADTIYYLNVSATDAASNGPILSSLYNFRTMLAPDTTAPIIVEGPMVIDISETGATVVWKTDEPATSGVSWNDGTFHDLVKDDSAFTINHSVRLTGLVANTIYNYTVSSMDAANNGPTLSVTKTFTTLPTPDTKAPVIIEGPLVVNVTHQSAVIRWQTDEPADGVVEYGTTESFGNNASQASLKQPHNMTLTGLTSATRYYFRVSSKDAAGNGPTFSATGTFTTDGEPNDKNPVITKAPEFIHKNDKKAVIYWETDVPCDSVVEYEEVGGETYRISDAQKVQKHQISLTNLNPNTAYNVRISSTDEKGNTVTAKAGKPMTFLAFNMGSILSDAFINAPPMIGFMSESQPDTNAPVITESPTVVGISSDRAIVKWVTDEISNSQVFYGTSQNILLQTAGEIVQKKNHLIVLTNLQPSTTFYYTVQSTDSSGNGPTISSILSFTTTDTPDQVAPQIISGPTISNATSTSVTVSWTTNELSTTQVRYGTASSNLSQVVSIPDLATDHQVTLSGLVTGATYFLQAVSSDSSANQVVSSTKPFTTAGSHLLTVTIDGNGSGSIGGGIPMCIKGVTCDPKAFPENSVVRLTPYPDTNSVFDGWNAICGVTGNNCDVTMDGPKTVTATFKTAHKVKIGDIPYNTLASAFAAANTGQIKARAIVFEETVTLTLPTVFKGGFNANFDPDSSVDNYTIIKGSLTIGKGASLTVEGLKIKPLD